MKRTRDWCQQFWLIIEFLKLKERPKRKRMRCSVCNRMLSLIVKEYDGDKAVYLPPHKGKFK